MRKGISQILSSVLLLAVTVSIAGVYSQWAPSFSSDTSQQVADQADSNLKCGNAAFGVSDVNYDITGNILTLEISNGGTINFNDDITVTGFNSSEIIAERQIGSLGVDENRFVEVRSDRVVEVVVVTSSACPELEVVEEDVEVTR